MSGMRGPTIDYLALSPLIAVVAGSLLCLLAGLISARFVQRAVVPALAALSLLVALGLTALVWRPGDSAPIIESALAVDTLTLFASVIFYLAGLTTIVLSLRSEGMRETGSGEYLSLVLASVAGMVLLAGAENLVTLFVGLELLSVPLYVLCGSAVTRSASLESGLKYLVIGSVGSATLLYGLALVYGATGSTDFEDIASAIGREVGVG